MEFSPDLRMLDWSPPAPTTGDRNKVQRFLLTPAGNCFLVMTHAGPNGRVATLYQLNRIGRTWAETDIRQLGYAIFPMLTWNDGESSGVYGTTRQVKASNRDSLVIAVTENDLSRFHFWKLKKFSVSEPRP